MLTGKLYKKLQEFYKNYTCNHACFPIVSIPCINLLAARSLECPRTRWTRWLGELGTYLSKYVLGLSTTKYWTYLTNLLASILDCTHDLPRQSILLLATQINTPPSITTGPITTICVWVANPYYQTTPWPTSWTTHSLDLPRKTNLDLPPAAIHTWAATQYWTSSISMTGAVWSPTTLSTPPLYISWQKTLLDQNNTGPITTVRQCVADK